MADDDDTYDLEPGGPEDPSYNLEAERCPERCVRGKEHKGAHRFRKKTDDLEAPDAIIPDEDRCTEQCLFPAGHGGSRPMHKFFPARHRPLVRTDDDWTAHLGAALIEPFVPRRCAAVLAYLRQAEGEWVDGWELANPEVGGSEGLRRCRQLRTDYGFNIERRPAPGSLTAWQYRLSTDLPWVGFRMMVEEAEGTGDPE